LSSIRRFAFYASATAEDDPALGTEEDDHRRSRIVGRTALGRASATGEDGDMRLSEEMQRLVREQGLGFVATVRPDGTPALSPKGTTSVWGDEQLVFLHLHSPGTVANLAHNPNVEVNVVDPIRRKGYRFAGRGRFLIAGEEYEQILAWFVRDREPT
jgi:hypothetical protein